MSESKVCVARLAAAWLPAAVLFGALLVSGCGSSDVVKQVTPEDRFKHAKELFDDRDYMEAINEFNVITVQDQGSAFAADAQYFLAEARFKRGEYLLSAFEYNVLRRSYPASPRIPEAQYKIALSYYNLAPAWSLDQQYTRKAIDEFQSFVEYYPKDTLVADAAAKIMELTTRLAAKEYQTAKLYSAMDYYRAALMSYDEVIERYHDTEFAPQAFRGKVELLMARNHYKEAGTEIDRFLTRYPNSVLKSTMESLKSTADSQVAAGRDVSSRSPVKPTMPGEGPQP
jgi:outer membrane protein assembly factor BamD